MMLLHLLLHVLIYHQLCATELDKEFARGLEKERLRLQYQLPDHILDVNQLTGPSTKAISSRDTNYVIKHIEECPDIGYYFGRDQSPNKIDPDPCYLCFCHREKSAVCWIRYNRQCDTESFQYSIKRETTLTQNIAGKNKGRFRRSFLDVFYRDIPKNVFNSNTENKKCKPYEASFSDDCPPADWCVGCTVCDCNANGKWDCHVLSFCPDNKKKDEKIISKLKMKKKPSNKKNITKKISLSTKASSLPKRGIDKKIATMPTKYIKKSILPMNKTTNKTHKNKTIMKATKRIYSKPINKLIKNNVTAHKLDKFTPLRSVTNENDNIPLSLESQVVQNVMAAVRQMIKTELKNITTRVEKPKSVPMSPTTRPPQERKHKVLSKKKLLKIQSKDGNERHKRALKETITQVLHRVKPFQTANNSGATNVILRTTSMLNYDNDYLTIVPMFATTINENEYFKYIVGSNIIPSSNNQTIDSSTKTTTIFFTNIINVTESIEKNKLETTTVNDIEKSTVKYEEKKLLKEIDTTPLVKMEKVTGKTSQVTALILTSKTNSTTVNISRSTLSATPTGVTTLTSTRKTNFTTVKMSPNTPSADIPSNVTKLTSTSKINVASVNISQNNYSTDTPTRVIINDFLLNTTFEYLANTDPVANVLKYNKLPFFKTVKDKKFENAINVIVNKPVRVDALENKRKKINRITAPKKMNVFKLLNYHKCPFLNNVFKKHIEPRNNLRGLQNIAKNILKQYNFTEKSPKKSNKINVITYLKKIMNTLFNGNKSEEFNRRRVIHSLCKSFGPCSFDLKDKSILSSKLADLDHETISILKTVQVLKRLLTVLDINSQNNKNSFNENRLGNNIRRLNNILKGNYTNLTKEPLTETKLDQLDCMKKNIQNFVQSVGKFSILLKDIMFILTKRNMKAGNKNMSKNSIRKGLNESYLVQNLKHMLVKYNIIQNKFIKKMYSLINSLNGQMINKTKVSNDQDLNDSEDYENLSKKIIQNLRKLKNLSHTINHIKRPKREVRDEEAMEYLLMIMEYLLRQQQLLNVPPVNDGIDLLIDAIQNAPDIKTIRKKVLLNIPSTNSTLMLHPSDVMYRSTTGHLQSSIDIESETISNEDSSKTVIDTSEEPLNKKIFENKDIFEMIEEDKDSDDKILYDRRTNTKFLTTLPTPLFSYADNELENNFAIDDISLPSRSVLKMSNRSMEHSHDTESGIGNEDENVNQSNNSNGNYENNNSKDQKVYVNNFTEKSNNYETSISHNVYIANSQTDSNTSDRVKYIVTEKSTTPTLGSSIEKDDNDMKKMVTVFTAEVEDEDAMLATIASVASTTATISTMSTESDFLQYKETTRTDRPLVTDEVAKLDKKSKLEWIEANFGRDFNNFDDEKDVHKTYTTPDMVRSTRKSDVSSISNEVDSVNSRKKKSRTFTEDVMLKKHMDLMNSLDYGTDKIELEDADITETNLEDKEPDNPAYFV